MKKQEISNCPEVIDLDLFSYQLTVEVGEGSNYKMFQYDGLRDENVTYLANGFISSLVDVSNNRLPTKLVVTIESKEF